MKVWVLFFDGVAVSHYQNWGDLNRDMIQLKKNLGSKCPVISRKIMTMGLY